jgi:hypothetical protein
MQRMMRKRPGRAQGVWMAGVLGIFLALPPQGCLHTNMVSAGSQAAGTHGVTDIAITDAVLQPAVERLGINLSENDYFDSGMMLKNLVARDPGFEGGSYRSILRCIHPEATRCADEDTGSVWPKDFWQGGVYEWITGPLEGRTGSVTGSSAAVHDKVGAVLQLGDSGGAAPEGKAEAAYLVVHKDLPGDATAGWWPKTEGAATLTTEFHDLSPHTQGKQAVRMSAGAGAYATLSAFFDSMAGRTFLRLHGRYRLSFRAKAVSGSTMHVELNRQTQPATKFLSEDVALENQWQDMHLDFDANDVAAHSLTDAAAVGTVALTFSVTKATVLLDDVSLEAMDGDATNTTVFRDAVVDALRAYHPGVLRFMENDTGLGNGVGNLLAPAGARLRAGYGPWSTEQEDVGFGLPEFLALCATVHADPWIVVPASVSAGEMQELVRYLALPIKGRAAWSATFGKIHLELGNEEWNGVYKGETIEYPEDYGHRIGVIFRAARQSKGFNAAKFDLIAGGQGAWPGRNHEILTHADAEDSLAIAPYLLHNIPAAASTDAVFGALFAQPEQMVREGEIAQNLEIVKHAAAKPVALTFYETNLHATEGTPAQATLDAMAPSIGAGVAMASEMLQSMRAGVRSQALFALPGWSYKRSDGSLVKLWGTVVDMGVTNRRRPQFLAAELVNAVLHGAMTATFQGGENPTWNETSGIDGVNLQNAHMLQSFAFRDGEKRSVVLINLSRSAGLAVDFTGAIQPHGSVTMSQMTAARITDSNEDAENVKNTTSTLQWSKGQRVTVPAFSVMVLQWNDSVHGQKRAVQ